MTEPTKQPNYMRGFNRAYLVLVGIWEIWWLVVVPLQMYSDMKSNMQEPELSFAFDYSLKDVNLWLTLIVEPMLLYALLRLAVWLFGWVSRGFKSAIG